MLQQSVDSEQVRRALKEVIDPELGVNIVDLGLVYDIKRSDDLVTITMTLTTPGCPAASYLEQAVADRIEALPGVDRAVVDVVWTPPWTPDRMTDHAKQLLGIR